MLDISFIVPVYNVAKYLNRCVDSLLQQNLKEDQFEVVLIDDGSTDNSGIICDEYSLQYNNIHTIHNNNNGLSEARNTGVYYSRGQYIQFVDSDDYLATNSIIPLLQQIKSQDLEVLRFNYENVDDDGVVIQNNKNPKLYTDYSKTITNGISFLNERLGYACYACQFILRRSIAKDYPFLPGIHFEDTEWISRMMPSINRISSNPAAVYKYRIREGSITKGKSKELIKKNALDRLQVISILKKRKCEITRSEWIDGMISHMVVTLLCSSFELPIGDRKKLIKSLKALEVYPLTTYHMTNQARRKICLINFSPHLFCLGYSMAIMLKDLFE